MRVQGLSLMLLAGLLLLSSTSVISAANSSPKDTIANATEQTDSVRETLAATPSGLLQIINGGALGVGLGLIIGSAVTYTYWKSDLK